MNSQGHPFHLVDPSPWTIISSIGAFSLTSGSVMWFHSFVGGGFLLFFGLSMIISMMVFWWRDVVREGAFEGNHNSFVEMNLRLGMVLFIASEVMFFFAFFWGFFYSSINPAIEVGAIYPPVEIVTFNAWEVPLANTLILLTSGSTVTLCHNSIITGDRTYAIISLIMTILLAILFTVFQVFEYMHASFTVSDSIYGSTFFLATGFHGFHVLIGTFFLTVCLFRVINNQFTREHHFGFEAAAWYWHFVDVVWLFLFLSVYWWGGN